MKYRYLKKLFHMNERSVNDIYMKRFESEASHKLEIKINDFECFYMNNDEIINLIGNIYDINTWLEKTIGIDELSDSAYCYLTVKSLIEEIISSNKLEGLYCTNKELEEMISNDPPKNYKKFYGMVNKYVKLTSEPFTGIETPADIRRLYDVILMNYLVGLPRGSSFILVSLIYTY